MKFKSRIKNIGILGGGPSGMFMFKRLIESGDTGISITIFEKNTRPGAGLPYSTEGACNEHVTNVSDNELPEMVTSMKDWLQHAPTTLLQRFDMNGKTLNEFKVVPRLLFGEYLSAQFDLLINKAKKAGIETRVLLNTTVLDIEDQPIEQKVKVTTTHANEYKFDAVIMCTGHNFPKRHEGKVHNWFDSPYPPVKLALHLNEPAAIKGSSLTAIDAIRTLARNNGTFIENESDSNLTFKLSDESPDFRLVMHSLGGLLPAVRFHLEDSHLSKESLMPEQEVLKLKAANGGFISLDYIFEQNFKQPLLEVNPAFYDKIKDLSIEEFVEHMMELREKTEAFQLFKAEYAEAEKSIKRHQSVHWKEMLAVLSYAMNYPAKHLSAEDMMRLKKVLMPLISIVIAFVPQSSCRELLALHNAGVLSLVNVDKHSTVEPGKEGGAVYNYTDEDGTKQSVSYGLFVDAVGQPHFMYKDFPFASLKENGTVSKARLKFRSGADGAEQINCGNKDVSSDVLGDYYLQVPGININDHFQVLDQYGALNERIYVMAVPYIGGLNPDYSGLDFCETASLRISKSILKADPVAKTDTTMVEGS